MRPGAPRGSSSFVPPPPTCIHWSSWLEAWQWAGRTDRAVQRLEGWAPLRWPLPKLTSPWPPFLPPQRLPHGSTVQTLYQARGPATRAIDQGNLSPGRLRAALREGRTKAVSHPGRHAGQRVPKGHCWPVWLPQPRQETQRGEQVPGCRLPPAVQSRASLVQPGGSMHLRWGSRPAQALYLAGTTSASGSQEPSQRPRGRVGRLGPLPTLGRRSAGWGLRWE